jgi:glycine/D-amino acid oxidase-like deaminating enzyme
MPEQTDVVIVGGGILGVSLAEELTRRQQSVVLLEADTLASGATGGGFAWINATSKIEDEDYHRLNACGVARYDALAALWGMEAMGLHGGGSLFWTHRDPTPARQNLLQRAARLQDWDYPVALLNQAEMQALEPQGCFRSHFVEGMEGLFAPADRWLDTPRLIGFLAKRIRAQGGQIRERCPLLRIQCGDGSSPSWIDTPQGTLTARTLVLAAGIRTPVLVALVTEDPTQEVRFPLRLVPGLLVETPPDSAPGQAHRVLYPEDRGGLHLRPTPQGGLLLGADDTDGALAEELEALSISEGAQTQDLSTSDLNLAQLKHLQQGLFPQSIATLLQRAAHALPDLPLDALQQSATARLCMRPVPLDAHPIVGPLPGRENIYIAVTHSGITLGPLLASLLADEIVTGNVPQLLAPYRPDRFQTKLAANIAG